ncbi:hypothetical protein V5E97_38215 [Singulisphaera sp. Ch08]|uniref:Uncharacterized protein n=1 Tax=Singulisphaera sp. Ch08 TaxID=3120278 RepID=A0AAU7CTM5_9BACT
MAVLLPTDFRHVVEGRKAGKASPVYLVNTLGITSVVWHGVETAGGATGLAKYGVPLSTAERERVIATEEDPTPPL